MTTKPTFTLDAQDGPERIAKHIARAGVCSRREAEARIADGRVTVNGKLITSPALNVTAADSITVDGKPLPDREPARLWRYHKPRGLVVSARDEKDRQTISTPCLQTCRGCCRSVGWIWIPRGCCC